MSESAIILLTVFCVIKFMAMLFAMIIFFNEKFPDKPKDILESIKRFCFVVFSLEYSIYNLAKIIFKSFTHSFVPESFKLPSFPKFSIKKLVAKEDKIKLLKKDNQYRNVHCENCNCK